ncbi:MAG: sodium:proton antiporter [Syntrophothermus sp.]
MHSVELYSLVPFVAILLTIAVLPIFAHHWWENNKNKLIIAVALSIPVIIYLIVKGLTLELSHTLIFDYIPFIILIGSLYTITGGIYLTGDIQAKPIVNAGFLATGAVLASIMGTTGAAMLLIRALIYTNKERKFKVHTILFFIAVVANCGGLLTPLGDPPLFVMYLRGVSFFWFFTFFKEWLTVNAILIIIYFIVDMYYYKKESGENIASDVKNIRDLRIRGKLNFIWLAGVVLAVAFINENTLSFLKTYPYFKLIREAVILLFAILSVLMTPKLTRVSNNFTWEPIKEVAYLFLGIFITMIPCLIYLNYNAKVLGVETAQEFYYYAGMLSSFLDNTPTAVAFHSLAMGLNISTGNLVGGIPEHLMEALCTGAVLFGSMTYIGNGPNFMVKAVAEENNIKMPHFFGYMIRFSLIVLLPVFILVQLLFI